MPRLCHCPIALGTFTGPAHLQPDFSRRCISREKCSNQVLSGGPECQQRDGKGGFSQCTSMTLQQQRAAPCSGAVPGLEAMAKLVSSTSVVCVAPPDAHQLRACRISSLGVGSSALLEHHMEAAAQAGSGKLLAVDLQYSRSGMPASVSWPSAWHQSGRHCLRASMSLQC